MIIKISDIQGAAEHLSNIRVAVFDLDDTLYSEKQYVRSGYRKIAEAFPEIEDAAERLWKAFLEGKPAIDAVIPTGKRAAALEIYRNQMPDIELYPGVKEMLLKLKADGKKLGIITDGRPEGQNAKIKALGLNEIIDKIIITDALGGTEFRKPNKTAFRQMHAHFKGTPYAKMAYVGDNSAKDFDAPVALGMKAIHFSNPEGLYR